MQPQKEISIEDGKKILTIQEEFSHLFPYLKLEFFSRAPAGEDSHRKQIRSSMSTLGECRPLHNSGAIIISPEMTVDELEKAFEQSFGLWVQVFRKSGRVWIETSVTNNWSLEKQNLQGEELSRHFSSENRDL